MVFKFRPFHRVATIALVFYIGMAILLLHPLIVHTGTHAGGFDFFNYNWNFWWIRHALSTEDLSVYQSDFVFYPTVNNFGYHALAAVWYPLWALTEPVIGTLGAVTLIIFVGCVLNGFVTYLWLREEGVAPSIALIGGAALQALPISRYFYYNTHLNLMDWFWLPAHLLFWRQIVRSCEANKLPRALLWSLIMGLGVWGLGLTDLQFPIFVAALIVPYGLWTLYRSPARARLILFGIIAIALGGSLLWFAGPLPHMARFSGTLAPGPAEERPGVPFPGGFLSMSDRWWMWDHPSLGAFTVIILIAALAISIAYRRDFARVKYPPHADRPAPRWFWLIAAMPPFIFSLGATLTILGVDIPLPFRILHAQTSGMFRMPWRLAPIFVIATLAFVGITFTHLWITRRPSFNRKVAAIIASFLLLTITVRLFETAPLDPVLPQYDFYTRMGEETGDYVVLEVPTAVGTGEVLLGEPRAIQYQMYGMTHGKRMINGFVSRASVDRLWEIYLTDPMLAWLGQRVPLDASTVADQLHQRVFDYPIGYIVVHTDLIGTNTSTVQEIVGFLNQQNDSLCPPFQEGDAIVYRSRWHPEGCADRTPPEVEPGMYQIDIGGDDSAFIGWGWHWRESIFDLTMRWTGETPQTDVYVQLPEGRYEISLTAQSFWENRQLSISVNGAAVGESVSVTPDALNTFTFAPADFSGDTATLTLNYDSVIVPVEVGQSADTRRLAVMIDSIEFRRVD